MQRKVVYGQSTLNLLQLLPLGGIWQPGTDEKPTVDPFVLLGHFPKSMHFFNRKKIM